MIDEDEWRADWKGLDVRAFVRKLDEDRYGSRQQWQLYHKKALGVKAGKELERWEILIRLVEGYGQLHGSK